MNYIPIVFHEFFHFFRLIKHANYVVIWFLCLKIYKLLRYHMESVFIIFLCFFWKHIDERFQLAIVTFIFFYFLYAVQNVSCGYYLVCAFLNLFFYQWLLHCLLSLLHCICFVLDIAIACLFFFHFSRKKTEKTLSAHKHKKTLIFKENASI